MPQLTLLGWGGRLLFDPFAAARLAAASQVWRPWLALGGLNPVTPWCRLQLVRDIVVEVVDVEAN